MACGHKSYLSWRGAFDERRDRCNVFRCHDESVDPTITENTALVLPMAQILGRGELAEEDRFLKVPYKATAQYET